MSIMDRRASSKIPIIEEPTYDIKTTFNPGNAEAPWSGFATNINEESKLRNQFFALQNCEQANYVPSTTSDMYTVKVSGREEKCVFPNFACSLGSNSIEQARVFHKSFPLSGLIITKLDGTSRGGALVGIYRELKLPIYFVGLGEQPDDLQPFSAVNYSNAIFGIPE